MSNGLPLWQIQLWPPWKQGDFGTVLGLFKTVSSHPTKWLVFNDGFLDNFNLGDVTENFVFKINNDTEVYGSCSATLNGEVFVFGGENTSYNRRKQVSMNQRKVSK